MIPIGTRMVYAGQWKLRSSFTPASVELQNTIIPQLGRVLIDSYNITIEQAHANPHLAAPAEVQLSLLIGNDYGDVADIKSIVDNEAESGSDPVTVVSSDFTQITLPEQPPELTGAPGVNVPDAVGTTPDVQDGQKKPCTWIDTLLGNTNCVEKPSGLGIGTGVILLVLGLAIVAAVLIAVAPSSVVTVASRRRA